MMRRFVVLAFLGACFQDVPQQTIPCDGDETCPTGMYCGFAYTCDLTLPAHLVVDGASLSNNGPFGEVDVPRASSSRIYVKITNNGHAPTDNLTLVTTTPACLNQTDAENRFSNINPANSTVFDLDVMPMASCASPQTIKLDFDAAYRGHTSGTMYHRTWSGTVTVKLH
jgi:hypothetical protein